MALSGNGVPTKVEVMNYIAMTLGVPTNSLSFVMLNEKPVKWKHSCVNTGVVELPYGVYYLGQSTLYVAVCNICSKVLVYVESYM